jgi:hypothetical protein
MFCSRERVQRFEPHVTQTSRTTVAKISGASTLTYEKQFHCQTSRQKRTAVISLKAARDATLKFVAVDSPTFRDLKSDGHHGGEMGGTLALKGYLRRQRRSRD